MSQDQVNDSLKRRLQRSVGEDRQALVEGLPYEVGFGKPPRHARFRPGVSGNPGGRPRGAQNLETILTRELSAKIEVTENGRRKRVSKLEVMMRQVINKAAGGDLKAFVQVAHLAQRAQAQPKNAEAAPVPVSEADLQAVTRLAALMGLSPEPQEELPSSPGGTQ